MRRRLADLTAGLRSWPGIPGWGRAALELGWAVPLMLIVVHLGNPVGFQFPPDAITSLGLIATLFVAPALGEEMLFRGLLIPRSRSGSLAIVPSVLLFVLWHPLQAVTFGPPWASAFLEPSFLAAVAILGVALGRIYAATRSLWPCIFAHWLVVLGWKLLLGGPL